jgi:diphthamide biosynthesis protein 3
MALYYDEIEIEDFTYDKERDLYTYPCPCGDKFQISTAQLRNGEDIARCPSCSLIVRVIYDPEDFMDSSSDSDDEMRNSLLTNLDIAVS